MRPRPDPYEYLDRHTEERADEGDRQADYWRHFPVIDKREWPIDVCDPDDREPMGGDPYWREDEE